MSSNYACCGKKFKNAQAWGAHNRFYHPKKTKVKIPDGKQCEIADGWEPQYEIDGKKVTKRQYEKQLKQPISIPSPLAIKEFHINYCPNCGLNLKAISNESCITIG